MGFSYRQDSAVVINPSISPGLHVELFNGTWDYIPSVGRELVLGVCRYNAHRGSGLFHFGEAGFKIYSLANISVDLLDPVSDFPPPEMNAKDCAMNAVEKAFTDHSLSGLIMQHEANALEVTHGRLWGFLPEDIIRERLARMGFLVQPSYIKTGGRNRIITHAMLLR
ncbi:hypothetical protein HYU11_06605 [Candidatus Woesearchaeota archaeon]|nr:hypothetical protein [Candidatus Woesearchaeota archaeon]